MAGYWLRCFYLVEGAQLAAPYLGKLRPET
jgi:hypothetical protein